MMYEQTLNPESARFNMMDDGDGEISLEDFLHGARRDESMYPKDPAWAHGGYMSCIKILNSLQGLIWEIILGSSIRGY